ncbi:hypothetical protein [Novosphingobium sp. B 225]|uniref:hypothetical protein n=1 Tax=Novosphingobium sp. B 225 TaxID=1961849 RepID=UPI000B4B891C|nr:hypothetical protein [Novosphingobium sp. B 225]
MIGALLALAANTLAAPVDIGPEPTMDEFIAIVEPALITEMPASKEVTFVWPYRLLPGGIGYYTCGKVGTFKGRVPREEIWVSAVVAKSKTVNTQWSTKNGMLAWICKRSVKKGELIPRG